MLYLQIIVGHTGISNVAGTRIMVLSDGDGDIGDLTTLVEQGIIVDTIAYRCVKQIRVIEFGLRMFHHNKKINSSNSCVL